MPRQNYLIRIGKMCTAWNFIKKRHMCFSVNFAKFFRAASLHVFVKLKGKDLYQTLCNLIKKETLDRRFPVNFAKFLRALFFTEQLQWLPLSVDLNRKRSIYLEQIN